MAKFPEWLDKNGLFQYTFGTDMETFEYWHSKPEILDNVNTLMEGVRSSRPAWVDWFPVQDRILDGVKMNGDAVVLVDVAGGRGHDLELFRSRFPQGEGKLVLEDLQAVIDDVKRTNEGIVLQKYDFFQPQPIQGTYCLSLDFWSAKAHSVRCTSVLLFAHLPRLVGCSVGRDSEANSVRYD